MEKKIFFKIYPSDYNLNKRWFLYYRLDNKRYKVYGYINRYKTVTERLNYIELLKEETLRQLQSNQVEKADPADFATLKFELTRIIQNKAIRLRPKTIASYRSVVKLFCEFCDEDSLDKILTDHINLYIQHLHHKAYNPTTINFHTATLKTLFACLMAEHVIWSNPCSGITKLREHRQGYDYFRKHQLTLIKNKLPQMDSQLWLACQMVYYCFLRPKSELRFLKIGDIDLHDKKILVRGEIAKNHKTQYIGIPEPLGLHLKELDIYNYPFDFFLIGKDGHPGPVPLGQNNMANRHKKAMIKLNLDWQKLKHYSWKHTGVVNFAKNGGNLKTLQLQLRHHSLDMVNIYLRRLGIMDCDDIIYEFPAI